MILSIVLLLLGKRAKSNQRKKRNISTNAKQLGKLDGSGPAENFV